MPCSWFHVDCLDGVDCVDLNVDCGVFGLMMLIVLIVLMVLKLVLFF